MQPGHSSNLPHSVHGDARPLTNGAVPYSNTSAGAKDLVKDIAGRIFWINAINLNDAVVWLHLYDAALSDVTVGTTLPKLSWPVPTNGDTNGAGFGFDFSTMGAQFDTGIVVAATTTKGGSTAPDADTLAVNLGYG